MPFALAADPVIQVTPVYPKAGQSVTLAATVTNSGGQAGFFSLYGVLVLSGTTSPVEANLGIASSTASANGSTTVTIETSGLTTYNNIANYNTTDGLDMLLTLINPDGSQTDYTLPSAVFLPAPGPTFQFASSTFSGNAVVGDYEQVTAQVNNTGTTAAQCTLSRGITTNTSGVIEGHWNISNSPTIPAGGQAEVTFETDGPIASQFHGQTLDVLLELDGGSTLTGTLSVS